MTTDIQMTVSVVLSFIIIGVSYGVGLSLDPLHIITLTTSGDTIEIIPLIDGVPPIDCPVGYRIKAVGYYDEKINYRCLLIQEKTDCLDTETYVKKTMTCVPTFDDPDRLECGDRYFLDSECHERYVNQSWEKI